MSKPIVLKIFKNGGVVDVKQFVHEHQVVLGSADADTHVKLQGQVSPFHASIEKRGERYILSDLGSTQGTYLKGQKVLEAALEHGDKIAVGEYIIEFYIGAPGVSPISGNFAQTHNQQPQAPAPAPAAPAAGSATHYEQVKPVTQSVMSSTAAGVGGGFQPMSTSTVTASVPKKKKVKGEKTFAPVSAYKNLGEFVRPTKGSTIEVLLAWKERIISAYHFHEKGTVYYGSHPGSDVVVPPLATKILKAPLLQLEGQASVFIPPGMAGSLVYENNSTPLTQLYAQGRLQSAQGGGSKLNLAQGEMVRIQLGNDVELVVRYCSETPKPVFIPFIDFASNGFLAVLLSIILAIVVSLYVALNKAEEKKEDEEEYRTALIIENPPPPPPVTPQPKVEEVKPPPPKELPPPPPKKVKQETPKETPKEVAKPVPKKTEEKPRTPVKQAQQAQKAGGGGNNKPAAALRANPNKPKGAGSVQQGASVKNAAKDGAQAESVTKDPSKSGLFGVFGSGGKQNKLSTDYSGGGELAGLASGATGKSGFAEDRAGEGLGSKLKEAGGTGNRGNVGVPGGTGGNGLGMGHGTGIGSGFGAGVGLGGKGSVTIVPGGGDEGYSGNIDRNGIRQVFINNSRALQSCYEAALSSDRGLGGKLVLDFDIGEQGRVLRADMARDKSTMTNQQLANCVINRMKNWRFPEPPQNQTVQVFYPLAFAGK